MSKPRYTPHQRLYLYELRQRFEGKAIDINGALKAVYDDVELEILSTRRHPMLAWLK